MILTLVIISDENTHLAYDKVAEINDKLPIGCNGIRNLFL